MSTRDAVEVHVWRDEPAASERGIGAYYSISTIDGDGEEVECIAGSSDRGQAWRIGQRVAGDLGVPCVEFARRSGP